MLLTIVRTKILAVLLGPAGIGLAGILNHIMATASTLCELGVSTSATRSVAKNEPTDQLSFANIFSITSVLGLLLALIGAGLLFSFSRPIAEIMLSDKAQPWMLNILAIGILFTVVANIQKALLNGLRLYTALARLTIASAFISSLASVIIACYLHTEGVIYYVIAVPIINLLVTLFFISQTSARFQPVKLSRFLSESLAMIRFGLPIMCSVLIDSAVILYVRKEVINTLGMEAAGLFQVAWAVTGIYIGFIFSAMMREYYPRLIQLAKSNSQTNAAVNQQIVLAIWLTTPLLLGITALAPLLVSLLYSPAFTPVIDTLRWMALGTVLKVITWAMGFIWVARGKGGYVLADSILWSVLFIGGVTLSLKQYGLISIGWVYTLSFFFALIYTFVFVSHMTCFVFQRQAVLECSLLVITCLSFIALNHWLSSSNATIAGGFFCFLFSGRSLFKLYKNYR